MHGVHTAIVTPFTANDAVDHAALERMTERQLAASIHGIVACGTTGETPTLSHEEWRDVVATTIHACEGGVPVTVGVGTNNTRTTVAHCEEAQALGAAAGLLVLPYYNKPNPEGHRAHVRAAAATGLPLVLYHVPGRTGQRVSAGLLAELASMDGVIGVKEATGDLRYVGDVIAATKTPILSGDDFTFLPQLALGGTGVISVVSNVDPARTVAVYDHFVAGRTAEAAVVMAQLWAITTWLFEDTNPVPCKSALAELGLCADAVRLPLARNPALDPRPLLAALGL